jgi:hypothetical protein
LRGCGWAAAGPRAWAATHSRPAFCATSRPASPPPSPVRVLQLPRSQPLSHLARPHDRYERSYPSVNLAPQAGGPVYITIGDGGASPSQPRVSNPGVCFPSSHPLPTHPHPSSPIIPCDCVCEVIARSTRDSLGTCEVCARQRLAQEEHSSVSGCQPCHSFLGGVVTRCGRVLCCGKVRRVQLLRRGSQSPRAPVAGVARSHVIVAWSHVRRCGGGRRTRLS